MTSVRLIAISIVLAACAARRTATTTPALVVPPPTVGTCDVAADLAPDDRPLIQDALDRCADVRLGPGSFIVTRDPFTGCGLHLRTGRRLHGAGRGVTTVLQAQGTAPSVRLICVEGQGAAVSDMSLLGQSALQTPDEHRNAIFVSAPGFASHGIEARDFAGDGVYVYTHVLPDGTVDAATSGTGARFDDIWATDNTRDGIVINAGGFHATHSKFLRNLKQQIDSEPVNATVDSIVITDNLIDAQGASNDYALTMTGASSTNRSKNWFVANNEINGPTITVWVENATVVGNHGVNPTTKPCYTVYRHSVDVTIADNTCVQSQTTTDSVPAAAVFGTGPGDMPERAKVVRNTLTATTRARTFGVRVDGALSVEVRDNVLHGPSTTAPGWAGIYVRTTIIGYPLQSAVVDSNTVDGWPDASVHVVGNTVAPNHATIDYAEFSDNKLSASTRAIVVDADAVPTTFIRRGNTCAGTTSCTTANVP